MMKNLSLIILSVIMVTGCGKSGNIRISGEYNGPREEKLYLHRVDVDIPLLIDSVKIGRSGRFTVRFTSDQPNFYNLGFDNREFITLIASPDDNIDLVFRGNSLQEDYLVSGSDESEKIRDLDMTLSATLVRLDSLRKAYSSATGTPGFDTIGPALEQKYNEIIRAQRKNNIAFILDNLSSLASIKALYQRLDDETYVLYDERDLQYLKLVSDTLGRYYPNSKQVKALASNLEKELNALYMNRISALAGDLQPTPLDAELPDIDGKLIKLSSLKNRNYVLLSFWSAESNECVANNLQMKEYYRIYKREGFEIYQVSIDQNEELWKSAVRFDELPWISVRDFSDGESRTASLFNVTAIPSNYLISPEGEIIGKNLFGKALQIKLSQIFD